MGIELVLNNISLLPVAPNREAARERIWNFRRAVSAAIQMKANRSVRCPERIEREFLADGYSIGDWLTDNEVDIDLRRSIRSWFTKSPYWQDDWELEQWVISRLFEFQGQDGAVGLGVAALLKGLSVSFSSDELWNQTQFEIRILTETLEEDDESLTSDEILIVRHFSHPNHLADHQEWIAERLAILPENGQMLWDNRQEWFPSLEFCTNTELQILALNAEKLAHVVEHLVSLQRYCETWDEGNFDNEQFPPNRISTESQATLQQYGHERTFICPDGQIRTFSWHLKFNPDTWRMYFFPLPDSRRIIIGYIGRHLRTVRFRH